MGRLNYLWLAVLLGGLVSALVLLGGVQDIRERAEKPEGKVEICHKTGSDNNPWQQIEVAEPAVPAHLSHGDMVGSCPSSDNGGDSGGGDNGNDTGGTTNITVNVNSNQNGNPVSSTAKPVASSASSSVVFNFKIGFQSIDKKAGNKRVDITFARDGKVVRSFEDVELNSDSSGVFSGSVSGIGTGKYDVFIKGDGYLARKFADVAVVSGVNNWNWGKSKLRVGDFNGDNKMDVNDVALLLALYTTLSTQATPSNQKYDVNGSGLIDISDVVVVIGNYTSLEIFGDQL